VVMCSQTVASGFARMIGCARRGVVERDGKPYCKQHDPEQANARRAASYAEWQAKVAADTQRRVCWGLSSATVEQLRDELARREAADVSKRERP